MIRGYGGLVSEICASVPDGVICFFVSYGQMEETVARWADQGVLDKIRRSKLVFIETKVRQKYIYILLSHRYFSLERGVCDVLGGGAVVVMVGWWW